MAPEEVRGETNDRARSISSTTERGDRPGPGTSSRNGDWKSRVLVPKGFKKEGRPSTGKINFAAGKWERGRVREARGRKAKDRQTLKKTTAGKKGKSTEKTPQMKPPA